MTHLVLPFKCTHIQCSESFENAELLEQHKNSAHVKVECPQCSTKVLRHLLDVHVERMHKNTIQTICEHCGKVFKGNGARLYHIRVYHEQTEPMQCDLCKEWFKNRQTIRNHMKYVHIQGKTIGHGNETNKLHIEILIVVIKN